MTIHASITPEGRDWLSRLSQTRHLLLGAALLAACGVLIWNASRPKLTRIPIPEGVVLRSPEDLEAALKAHGLAACTLEDGALVVPAAEEARCRQFLRNLTASRSTWADEWQKANEQLNPFSSPSERAAAREIARARRISQMLSEMPGILYADVVWDEQPGRGFRQESIVRATVYLRTDPHVTLTPEAVASIRQAVAGSKAHLQPDDVVVMDLSTGRTHQIHSLAASETVPSPDTDQPRDRGEHPRPQPAEVTLTSMVVEALQPLDPVPIPKETTPEAWTLREPESQAQTAMVAETVSFAMLMQSPESVPTPPLPSDEQTAGTGILIPSPFGSESLPTLPGVAFAAEFDASRISTGQHPAEAGSTDELIDEPIRNRSTLAWLPVARSRNDFRFMIWVAIAMVLLLSLMKGYHPAEKHAHAHFPDMELQSGWNAPPTSASSNENRSPRHEPADHDRPPRSAEFPAAAFTAATHDPAPAQGSRGRVHTAADPAPEASTIHTSEEPSGSDGLENFGHLAWLEEETIRRLYHCLPDEPWALALSGASVQIQNQVLRSLPRPAASRLRRQMDSLPAIRLRDVEEAQRQLGGWLGKLTEEIAEG